MAKRHIFTVHLNPQKAHPYETPEFVEESFNFGAFFFTWMWALYHRLWLVAAIFLLLNLLLSIIAEGSGLNPIGLALLQLAFQLVLGLEGNDLRRARLERKGHHTSDIVAAESILGAEQRFFERHFAKGIASA